jgi:streptomycin 6-kinase
MRQIAALPARLQAIVDAWGLTLGEELPGGRRGRCIAATAAEAHEGVLRVFSPPARAARELGALRAWDGRGAPKVLLADEDAGIALLERIRPGTPAAGASADEIAALLSLLRVEPPTDLPPLEAVVRRRLERAVREERAQGARAKWAWSALTRLAAAAPDPVLVHGDLGPRHVVRCALRGLCAIDPEPCAGDPAYDAATWIHAGGRPGRRARFEALAAAGVDRVRLRDWCGVIAVHG